GQGGPAEDARHGRGAEENQGAGATPVLKGPPVREGDRRREVIRGGGLLLPLDGLVELSQLRVGRGEGGHLRPAARQRVGLLGGLEGLAALADRRLRGLRHPEGHGIEVFGALRLPGGNTLIAGGNNNRVLEVSPEGKVVWSVGQDELPGVRLAWVATLRVLSSGNVVVGNCHAGPDSPQLFEVTRGKKVVWTFNDFKTFGNNVAAAQMLDIKGKVLR